MPKTRELIELFRAIGSHDLAQAASLSRKLAAQRGARGQYRAERDLLGALNGMAKPPTAGQPAMLNAAWSVNGTLMPLPVSKRLDQLALSPAVRKSFGDVIKEWKSREKLVEHSLPRRWRLLFHGPSGCGKSAAAAALATEMKLPGFLVRFDSLIGAYLGQTALRLRELFCFAAQTPCVLLFDEVDALAKRRGSPMEVGELDRIVIAFMQELDLSLRPRTCPKLSTTRSGDALTCASLFQNPLEKTSLDLLDTVREILGFALLPKCWRNVEKLPPTLKQNSWSFQRLADGS
jgi:hypothetical protein